MKLTVYLTIILCLGIVLPIEAQSSDRNYIKTTTYLKDDSYAGTSINTVQYYDGLGRLIQTVQQNVGPINNNQDLISVQEYDNFGRESKAWLPVYRTVNSGMYYAGVIATDTKTQYGNDAYAYSEPVYESSPLNHVTQQYGPGQAWRTAARPVKIDYLANSASDCIYYYMSGDAITKNGYYSANTLYVTKTTDEDDRVSCEFKDKLGRVVLQRQTDGTEKFDTYYVYDDYGNLRWVLPPMFESVANSAESCSNYGYYFKYDERNRCVEKKLPQATVIYYVYDKADRLIFSQDGEQRATHNWTFYKYDTFGRMILTGVWKNSGKTQADLNNSFNNTLVTESYSASGAYNYTWNTLSGVQSNMVLQANFYDSYNFRNNSTCFNNSNYAYATPAGFSNQRYGTDTDDGKSKGLLTGTIAVMLDDPNTQICTVFYYDYRGRMIQSVASNHLGGYEKEYINYSFTGKPVWKQMIHSSSYLGTGTITETYTYSYDQADRPTTTKYKLDSDPEYALSTLTYDNQGRLVAKNQSGSIGTTLYEYNIRNWITNVNASVLTNTIVFNEKLYYNDSYAGNTAQYNGNISAVSWQHLIGGSGKGYIYTYDGLNRLKKGQYLSGTTTNNAFTEEVSQYDKNGNILKMKRYARVSVLDNAGTLVDDLTLNYRGNILTDITDAVPATTSNIGFVTPNATLDTSPIYYNQNGSIKYNFYNGIAGIGYNVINLPDKILFIYGHSTQYSYDALGIKRRALYKIVRSNMNIPLGTTAYTPNAADVQSTLTSDYCSNGHIVYENNALKLILNLEGYVVKQSNGTNSYYYYAKDHLGNNRAVFAATPTTFGGPQQEISYYPFGMPHEAVQQQADGICAALQPYKFGGKEYDEMHGLNWYDFGARYFWSIVPVLTTIDPLAEKYPSWSPYSYALNNPINAIDPDGRSTWVKSREDGTYEVFNGDLNDKDKNIYVYTKDKDGNYTVRGESIGESDLMSSFYNSDEGAWSTGSIIDPNDNSGMDFFNSFNNEEPAITDYMANATGGEKYDFKRAGATVGGKNDNPTYYYRGMPMRTENGKTIYTSARDIGNFAAGYIAGVVGVPWGSARKQFDKLESQQQGRPAVEGFSTQNAQLRGWNAGININYSNPGKALRWTTKSTPGAVKWLFNK